LKLNGLSVGCEYLALGAGILVWAVDIQRVIDERQSMTSQKNPFGACCSDLEEAMTTPPNSSFFVENNILCLTIGYIQTEDGIGWFDHAIIFCPFCGKRLQTKEEITKMENGGDAFLLN
jgi:hypothetical protein